MHPMFEDWPRVVPDLRRQKCIVDDQIKIQGADAASSSRSAQQDLRLRSLYSVDQARVVAMQAWL